MRIPKLIERILAIIFLLITIALVVNAQAPPPSTNPPSAPLDTIAAVLVAFGAGYGASKLFTRKQ